MGVGGGVGEGNNIVYRECQRGEKEMYFSSGFLSSSVSSYSQRVSLFFFIFNTCFGNFWKERKGKGLCVCVWVFFFILYQGWICLGRCSRGVIYQVFWGG